MSGFDVAMDLSTLDGSDGFRLKFVAADDLSGTSVAGDHITVLDDGWVDEGSRGSGYYHVYTNDTRCCWWG